MTLSPEEVAVESLSLDTVEPLDAVESLDAVGPPSLDVEAVSADESPEQAARAPIARLRGNARRDIMRPLFERAAVVGQLNSVKLSRRVMAQPVEQILVPFGKPGKQRGFPPARPLLGRSGELDATLQRLDGPGVVTLLGSPGIGKTSLAGQVAACWSEPSWFCDLSTCRDRDELRAAVLVALGEPPGDAERLSDALREHGPGLLVLDNFEHLVAAAPELCRWRRDAEDMRLLVTSRERLAIDGERVVELEPLELPDGPASIADALAVRLFLARARDAGGRGLDQLAAIADIVRSLDGIPLAIELAAARTRLMTPARLAERIKAGGALSLSKRGHERHRTLAAAIAWSWALLSADEQQALVSCAIFEGSFTLTMLERVVGGDVVERVASLRDKSLIHAVGAERLGLYASIRAFACEQLAARSILWVDELRGRHAEAFAAVAQGFNRHRLLMARDRAPTYPADVRRDVGNFAAALEHLGDERVSARAELLSALVTLGCVESTAALELLTELRRHAFEPDLVAVTALASHRLLTATGRLVEAHDLLVALAADETVSLPARGMAEIMAGVRRRIEGDAEAARAYHERAASLLDPASQSALYGLNLACLGRLACDLQDPPLAQEKNEAAVRHQEKGGEWWLAALALANLAQLAQEQGDHRRAESLLERAIQRFREANEPTYESIYAVICAGLYLEQGRFELARRWFEVAPASHDLPSSGLPRLLHHGGRAVMEALEGHEGAALTELERARRAVSRVACPLLRVIEALYVAATDIALGRLSKADLVEWRRRLAHDCADDPTMARILRTNIDARFAQRLVRLALGDEPPVALRVHEEARWFELAGERVGMSRRGPPRLILKALIGAQDRGLGALDGAALVAHGWPGQRILANAAATRVRVAVATLRKLGLRDVILTRDDGYLIDPAVSVEVVAD